MQAHFPQAVSDMYNYKNPRVNSGYNAQGEFVSLYPPLPTYSRGCSVNVTYDTLPENTRLRHTILGPTSLKALYRGRNYYPPQYMAVPDDTLYGYNSNVYSASTALRTYGKAIYPYHHRSPREVEEFANDILPYPALQNWTRFPTLSDGAWGR